MSTRTRTRQVVYTLSTGEKYSRTTEPLTDEDLEEVIEYMKTLKNLKSFTLEPQEDSGHVIIHPDHLVSIEFF